ncbi:MAG: DUF362 domain-containing protein [bacterium]
MDKISRRDFLKAGAGIFASILLPRYFTGSEVKLDNGSVIGVAHGDKEKLVAGAVKQIGGIERFVKNGDRVLIKPNISFAANAECGATTSAEIVKQVVQLCLDAGSSKVIIVDYPLASAAICMKNSRIKEAVVDKTKVNILMLNKERQFYEVDVPDGKELKTVKIAKELNNVDVFINVPTAKSHSATGVSLGMKNLMGLIWDRSLFHRGNLHQAIAELAAVIKPQLTIVDATRALTSGGPAGPGKTVFLNTVIAGTDIVAVDSYTTGITPWYNRSFTGRDVKHIVAAYRLGLGEIDIEKVQIRKVEV